MAKAKSYKVKLVKSISGHTASHQATVRGLGLRKMNSVATLPATPAVFGMIKTVEYLIEWSESNEEFKPFGRRSHKKA